jgi:hypothetical protein
MHKDVQAYNDSESATDKAICELLANEIDNNLPEAANKIWHAHPVWFLEGNPIVGYSKLKDSIQPEGKFKAAEVRYTNVEQINKEDLKRWLEKAKNIQWDYKNIVKRKGVLERLV